MLLSEKREKKWKYYGKRGTQEDTVLLDCKLSLLEFILDVRGDPLGRRISAGAEMAMIADNLQAFFSGYCLPIIIQL